ncbi:MAG: FAD binding domain-containing protein [Brevefilum sp.]
MIGKYFRPNSVEEALALLTEDGKDRRPMGGGTSLSRKQAGGFDVVDLQETGMADIKENSQGIMVGAMVRLSTLMAHEKAHLEIGRAIRIDASENIRNIATLGGWLVSGEGRSVLTTVLLALDAKLTWAPGEVQVGLGDWLPLRGQNQPGVLLTEIGWKTGSQLTFEYVARSPKDQPIIIVAVARWGSGRTRVALGGFGQAPIIAMDGIGSDGVDIASRDAYFEAEDQWASAEYRREVAAKLALRCIMRLDAIRENEA